MNYYPIGQKDQNNQCTVPNSYECKDNPDWCCMTTPPEPTPDYSSYYLLIGVVVIIAFLIFFSSK
jgi:hypothetical protein